MKWSAIKEDKNVVLIVLASSIVAFLLFFFITDLGFAVCMSLVIPIITFIFILMVFEAEERGIEKGSERMIFREMKRIQKGERVSLKDVLLFSDRFAAYLSIKIGMKHLAVAITLIFFSILMIVPLSIAYLLHTMAGKGDFLSDIPSVLPTILIYIVVFSIVTYFKWNSRMKREMELMKES